MLDADAAHQRLRCRPVGYVAHVGGRHAPRRHDLRDDSLRRPIIAALAKAVAAEIIDDDLRAFRRQRARIGPA